MAKNVRLNKVIDLLEQDKVVFSIGTINNGNIDDVVFVSDSDYDFVIIENEHLGFDFSKLQISLQFLLDRKRILETGSLQPDVAPFVRIPPNARENAANQWIIQTDPGHGCLRPGASPHEYCGRRRGRPSLLPAILRCLGCPISNPRGSGAGLRGQQYATGGCPARNIMMWPDVWPLDPDGEILLLAIVEEAEGVRNVRDILREVKGIGAVWAGPGDMSVSMGEARERGRP